VVLIHVRAGLRQEVDAAADVVRVPPTAAVPGTLVV